MIRKAKRRKHHLQKFYFKENLKNISKKDLIKYLNTEVFEKSSFKMHIKEVSHNLNIDEDIVEKVVKSYIINVSVIMNTVRKIKTKINIYAFFSFIVEKGKRV